MREESFHFRRADMWREGEWLDLWSVVHLLSGVSTGFALHALAFGVKESFVIAFVVFVAYEFWEAMVDIEETPKNRLMDVLVGMGSFSPTFLFLAPALEGTLFWGVFALVLASNIVLATFGWIASRKAAALEERLRERYHRRKEQKMRRRIERRSRA